MKESDFEVSESIFGNWHYHISIRNKNNVALCSKSTMSTSMSLTHWGSTVPHLPMTYCKECHKIFLNLLAI